MKNFIKWIPSVIPVISVVLNNFSPQIQSAIGSNPKVSLTIAALYSLLAHLAPSPLIPPNPLAPPKGTNS